MVALASQTGQLPTRISLPARRHGAAVRPRGAATVRATGFEDASFSMEAAPLLIPGGDWVEVPGSVCAPKGFKATGMFAGLRARGEKGDLCLVTCDEGATAAGAFTLNVMCAAPVTLCKQVLAGAPKIKAVRPAAHEEPPVLSLDVVHSEQEVLTNAGQANAATGDLGMQDAKESVAALAAQLGCGEDQILVMSTGVIGRRIKLQALKAALPALAASLGSSEADARRAAIAITTTDLVSKSCALQFDLDGTKVTLGGISKGSGMIHPNMATMLALLTCDAAVAQDVWAGMLSRSVDRSFNAITVDGDTSTNDTVLALASGAAGNELITDAASPAALKLEAALTATLQGMAKAIAWDGEGATCLLEVTCVGAATEADARTVAKSVASSSLAKAAFFGHDPNWGRIACAAGYSGASFKQEELGVKLGPYPLMEGGQPLEFDAKAASKYLKDTCAVHGTVEVLVSIGSGPASGVAWGCDLSFDYVKINAEYST